MLFTVVILLIIAFECWATLFQQCDPCQLGNFWMISESRFGTTHSVLESPALGILFFGMISESRFVNTHYVVEHTTLGILIY